jgi:ribosomal protein S27AE
MPRGYWLRHRRCPDCGASRPEPALGWVTSSALDAGQLQYRECPACGFSGPLAAFPIVEQPSEPDEGTPS